MEIFKRSNALFMPDVDREAETGGDDREYLEIYQLSDPAPKVYCAIYPSNAEWNTQRV